MQYSRERMLGASTVFSGPTDRFLHNERPSVLPLQHTREFDLGLNNRRVSGMLQRISHGHLRHPPPLRAFNPSIVAAPQGLCDRCAFVASVRAEVMHQCNRSSPLYQQNLKLGSDIWYKNTALAVLDSALRPLGWTWLLTRPAKQIATWEPYDRMRVGVGVHDDFDPPWSSQAYDLRLLNHHGALLATYVCESCDFGVSLVQLVATPAAGGSLQLRAWVSERVIYTDQWAHGRNQVLFSGPSNRLLVQPWLGMVAHGGLPSLRPSTRTCYAALNDSNPNQLSQKERSAQAAEDRLFCGSLPVGARLRSSSLHLKTWEHGHFLALNKQRVVNAHLVLLPNRSQVRAPPGLRAGSALLSPTANLVRVTWGGCEDLLIGVGHAHRGSGPMTGAWAQGRRARKRRDARRAAARTRELGRRAGRPARMRDAVLRAGRGRRLYAAPDRHQTAFTFGFDYTHFLYALSPRPPHRLVASSAEFCLASAQDGADCESVQFVSGLALASGGEALLLAYGVNDCESKLGVLPLARAWAMLSRGGRIECSA